MLITYKMLFFKYAVLIIKKRIMKEVSNLTSENITGNLITKQWQIFDAAFNFLRLIPQ